MDTATMSNMKTIFLSHVHSNTTINENNRFYFENLAQSINKRFEYFTEYYQEITCKKLTMKYKTYFKFFRET